MSYREDDICVIEFLHAPSGVTLNEAGDSGNVTGTRGGLASAPRGPKVPPGVSVGVPPGTIQYSGLTWQNPKKLRNENAAAQSSLSSPALDRSSPSPLGMIAPLSEEGIPW